LKLSETRPTCINFPRGKWVPELIPIAFWRLSDRR
jgi:hypothetical protein